MQIHRLSATEKTILAVCWCGMQFLLLRFLGINRHEEAEKYISLARDWYSRSGTFDPRQIFYSGYICLHLLLLAAGLPVTAMYFLQLVVAGIGFVCFIGILRHFLHSRKAVFFTGLLYCGFFPLHQWTTALFTDGLFANLLMVTVYLLLVPARLWQAWIMLFALSFFRPIGFLAFIPALFWWRRAAFRYAIPAKAAGVIWVLSGIAFSWYTITSSHLFFYPFHNLEVNIICGYPSGLLRWQKVPYKAGMSVAGYLIRNPVMTAQLFLFRFARIFWMLRDYFSTLHNLLIFAATVPAIGCALLSLLDRSRNRIRIVLRVGVLVFCIPSVVFCVDWSGRFSLPVIDFLLLLAGFGVDLMIRRFNRNQVVERGS